MLPECMTTNLPARPCSRAHPLSRGWGAIDAVSTQFGMTRSRPGATPFASRRRRIVSPIATTRSARRSPNLVAAARARGRSGLELAERERGLREHVLAHDDERRAEAAGDCVREAGRKGGFVNASTTSGRRSRSAAGRAAAA